MSSSSPRRAKGLSRSFSTSTEAPPPSTGSGSSTSSRFTPVRGMPSLPPTRGVPREGARFHQGGGRGRLGRRRPGGHQRRPQCRPRSLPPTRSRPDRNHGRVIWRIHDRLGDRPRPEVSIGHRRAGIAVVPFVCRHLRHRSVLRSQLHPDQATSLRCGRRARSRWPTGCAPRP